jgi:hypothetical protein
LLKNTLRLWVAARMTTCGNRICGDETLGMVPDDDNPSNPLFGAIGIPPVMTNQLELILIGTILTSLKKTVLSDLQSLILANKPTTWFTIYLCIFMLLHLCAIVTDNDAMYARKHGYRVCSSSTRSRDKLY